MANRDRVRLAFIHVPTEGGGEVGGRQVQGLGRVRGWMTPALWLALALATLKPEGWSVGGSFGRLELD